MTLEGVKQGGLNNLIREGISSIFQWGVWVVDSFLKQVAY